MPLVASGPLQVELRLGKSHCAVKGCAEEQVAYNSYYSVADYPVTMILREPVYVEVHILGRTDPNIVLVLNGCWATASPNPYSSRQWDLLVNGCPYTDDRYLTKPVPVNGTSGLAYPTHYRRFVFKMFTFVDETAKAPLHETIYIHCSTAVCLPSAQDSCEPQCFRRSRWTPTVFFTLHPPPMTGLWISFSSPSGREAASEEGPSRTSPSSTSVESGGEVIFTSVR
ncbi:zona pellucida glycoprotein 2, tandem duplicate 1 precursor [Silurus asotus]|uniref:Zona pellucida glycoprotein 2, tandem duplicate 1 n=1 Tax=Silurus asotus TaxID=30991 RepID=A0AAD5FG61_SILAS|nr:zona pellucida glycoprotein 2, tandem duplicate 1 precursor [Silurus asotus]